jgi:hypothetical protein
MGDRHLSSSRHLRICREAVWGQCPASPSWQVIPILGDGYTLRARCLYFSPDTEYGGFRRSVHLPACQQVRGVLLARLWPEAVALLMEMALDRDNGELHSYCADCYAPSDPRRVVGTMVDRFDLETSGSGRGIQLRLEMVGRSEERNADLRETDFDYAGLSLAPFTFDRAAVSLDGSPVTCAEGFAVRVRNGLSAGPSRGGYVAFLAASKRAVSLELTRLDDDGAFAQAVRGGGTLSFMAALAHPQGHALTVELPNLYPVADNGSAAPGELAKSVYLMEAGTDSNGDDITYRLD